MKIFSLIFLMVVFFLSDISAEVSKEISEEVKKQSSAALSLCKYIHQNPELSFMEFQTAELMATEIEKIISAINRMCRGAALTTGMPEDQMPKVSVDPVNTPPVVNEKDLTENIEKFSEGIMGAQNVIHVKPVMGAEDFGKYGRTPEKIHICLIWLGITKPELMAELKSNDESPPPLHSAYLNPDYQKAIETGIEAMVANVIELMEK